MALKKNGEKDMRGGVRFGAGRPALTDASQSKARPRHTISATPEEFELIRRFIKQVHADPERCSLMLDFMDTIVKKKNGARGITRNPNKPASDIANNSGDGAGENSKDPL